MTTPSKGIFPSMTQFFTPINAFATRLFPFHSESALSRNYTRSGLEEVEEKLHSTWKEPKGHGIHKVFELLKGRGKNGGWINNLCEYTEQSMFCSQKPSLVSIVALEPERSSEEEQAKDGKRGSQSGRLIRCLVRSMDDWAGISDRGVNSLEMLVNHCTRSVEEIELYRFIAGHRVQVGDPISPYPDSDSMRLGTLANEAMIRALGGDILMINFGRIASASTYTTSTANFKPTWYRNDIPIVNLPHPVAVFKASDSFYRSVIVLAMISSVLATMHQVGEKSGLSGHTDEKWKTRRCFRLNNETLFGIYTLMERRWKRCEGRPEWDTTDLCETKILAYLIWKKLEKKQEKTWNADNWAKGDFLSSDRLRLVSPRV